MVLLVVQLVLLLGSIVAMVVVGLFFATLYIVYAIVGAIPPLSPLLEGYL